MVKGNPLQAILFLFFQFFKPTIIVPIVKCLYESLMTTMVLCLSLVYTNLV